MLSKALLFFFFSFWSEIAVVEGERTRRAEISIIYVGRRLILILERNVKVFIFCQVYGRLPVE